MITKTKQNIINVGQTRKSVRLCFRNLQTIRMASAVEGLQSFSRIRNGGPYLSLVVALASLELLLYKLYDEHRNYDTKKRVMWKKTITNMY